MCTDFTRLYTDYIKLLEHGTAVLILNFFKWVLFVAVMSHSIS